MKRILFTIISSVAISLTSMAQSPQAFKYQAVVRDAGNTVLNNQAVGLQLTIQQGAVGGTAVYTETFSVTTNQYGLVNIEIGTGTTTDDFSTVDWANGPYYMETAIDVTGGTSYSTMGTSQLLSVPYALYAANGGKWEESGTDIYNGNSGFVGVNTNVPTSDLHIKMSDSPFPDPTTGGLTFENANGANEWQVWNSNPYLSFAYDNVRVAYVNSATGDWVVTSDRRYKKNIEEMSPIMDDLMKLRPVRYHYKRNANDEPKIVGFIAQEVQEVFPELVYSEDGTQLALARADYAILAIKAIQEQQNTITELENKLKIEVSQNEELKQMVLELARRVGELEK